MKELEITPEIIRKYKENPNICPFCGSTEISGDHVEAEDWSAYRNVQCFAEGCHAEWTEVFAIVDICDAFINNE